MRARLRDWWGQTHGSGFELVRHFVARFFDSEMVTTAGEWQKVAIGVFAALLSAGILGFKPFLQRYNHVHMYLTADAWRQCVREDMLFLAGGAMALTALLTLLLWPSLFPSARDYLALAGLPVSARRIFQAKFGALLLLFAAYVMALTGPPSALFAFVISGRWQNASTSALALATLAGLAGACAFVFFSLLALQGLLLNVLPDRIFARMSLIAQAVLFIGTLGAVPLLGHQPDAQWWPVAWFLRPYERPASLAVVLPPALCLLAYLLSYHRYRRLLLEAPPQRSGRRAGFGSRLLERWIPDPRQQAAFAFIWKTLARSRSHRLILLAYAGLALGWIGKGALDTPRPSLEDQGLYGLLLVLVPLALSMLIAIGLRYVFSLPVALRANWVFQVMDRDGRAAWLAAVERFVVWCGFAPVFLASLPAAAALLGTARAAAATVLTFFAALLWFELMFREWRKLPFTCSYLPGKKPILTTILRYGLAIPFLAPLGKLILHCSGDPTAFAALVSLLAFLWWRMRAGRRALWSQCALLYEETPEAAVTTLGVEAGGAGGFAYGHLEPAAPPAFSLVESRGRIGEAWAAEMAEDRRHPGQLLETFLEDVRYGFRLICRNPLFSAVVVLTLTVGIGINTSVFTVINGVALRPHVYKDPDSFLRVVPIARMQNTARPASFDEYVEFRDHSRTLRQLAAYAHFPAFIGEDNSAGSIGMVVSCNFFQVEGLDRAAVGRLLGEEDCLAGQPPVAVISRNLWRARFGADPRIAGRRVEVNNRPVTIVGVVENRTAGWSFPASIWMPYTAQANFEQSSSSLFGDRELWLSLAGRLAPGRSRSDARAELSVLARRHDHLRSGRDTVIAVTDGSWLRELELNLTGQRLMLLAFFLGAFNLVLFISCANVATLLLARAAARRREIAVRLSLGAPRIRLVRMLVTESLLLAAVAGAASTALAWRVPEPLFRMVTSRPVDIPLAPDWHTFAYVAGVVLLTGVLAGLAPALESVKVNLTASLKGATQLGTPRARRLEGLLVSAQVALSMVLLVEASLFAHAEDHTLRGDPGYLPRQVVMAPVFFPDGTTPQNAAVRLAAIAERVRALPGVRAVAYSEGMPVFDHVTVELRPPARPDASQPVDVYTASPAFFETLGIPLLRGRGFALGEVSSVVISQRLARAFWPRQEALGKLLDLPIGRVTVVGVARDIDPLRFGGSDNPALYRPWRLDPVRNVLSVRFDAGAATGAAAVRGAVREVDPKLLVLARLAQTWIDQLTEQLWNVVALIVVLGLVATLLATAGIYGAVSFAVSRRTRELGIRVALGAGKLDIFREVFRTGGKPVVQGLLAGLWLSAATAAGLRQSVSGSPLRLDTANPLLYAGAALLLAAAAVAAMLAPARRGARSDPLESLRCE